MSIPGDSPAFLFEDRQSRASLNAALATAALFFCHAAGEERTPTPSVPLRHGSADIHLIVPPDLADFIVTHKAFRREQRR